MPKPPRPPGDSSEPPAFAIFIIVAIFVGLPTLFEALGWFGISWRSFVPWGKSDNWYVVFIFGPLLLVPLVALITKLVEARIASGWQKTTGRVTKSGTFAKHHKFIGDPTTVRNEPHIEYTFKVGDSTYTGARVAITESGGTETEATIGRYPVGKTVTVYYDTADPNNCVLEREIPKGLTSGCLGMLAAVLAFAAFIYFATTNATKILAGYLPPNGNAPMTVFLACFGLAALFFFFSWRKYVGQAQYWPSVQGKVAISEVETYVARKDGRDQTHHTPVVEYAYSINGIEYHSRQISLGMTTEASQGYAEKLIAKYPRDSNVTVHYDPQDPANAALENHKGYSFIILAIVAATWGLAVFTSAIFR